MKNKKNTEQYFSQYATTNQYLKCVLVYTDIWLLLG